MKFSLKNKVLPNGFNKQAVFTALAIVMFIIVLFITYVLTNNMFANNSTSEKAKKIDINDDTADAAIINDIANVKPTASIPVVKSNASGILINPTIVMPSQQQKIETEYDKQAKQVEEQARMKRLQAQFAAPASKSSMTGSSSKENASSANSQLANKTPSQKTNSSSTTSNPSPGSGTTYLDSELVKPKSPYLVQAGSIIPCVMISGINSDISGQVIAQVRENVYDSISSRYLLIPQGSKLIGSFSNQVAYGQQRLGVAWTRIIYPNGYSIDLKGIPGSDVSGFSGFYDQVDNHYWSIFGSSFVIGIITAGIQYSQNNTNPNVQIGGIGVSTNPTIGQTVAGSLGQQLGQTALVVTQKGLNIAPTLTIRQGYMFTVMLTADVTLKPYR